MHDREDPIPALKKQVAAVIAEEARRMPQAFGAYMTRTDQPRISEICRGKLDRFSLDRLIRMVSRLGYVVKIEFTHPARARQKERTARAQQERRMRQAHDLEDE